MLISRHKLSAKLLAVTEDRLLHQVTNIDRDKKTYITTIDVISLDHELLHSLEPNGKRKWSPYLTACVVPGTGDIMVADHQLRSLDVFNNKGRVSSCFY